MRIGLVCPYSWDVPGGVQQHVRDLAEALREFGHEVEVLAPCDRPDELPANVTAAGRTIGVPYNGSTARVSFGVRVARRVRSWVRAGDFDLLHVHEPAAPSLSLLACWIADVPIVATFHTNNARSRAMSVSAPALRTALGRVNGRIAVSEAARRTLVEHLGGDAVVIPNGVRVARYREALPLPGWPGRGGALGFLGRVDEPRKGLPVLLEAFASLARERRDLRLLLAGPGDASAVTTHVPSELRDRVVATGRLSEEDKIRAYHSVDVFCAPNLGGESFGIVLAEAMASGTPIVASDISAFRDVLGDGQVGALFPVGQPEALAATAAELLDDPRRCSALAAGARASATRFDWTSIANDVVRVYETVCPPHPAAAPRTPPRIREHRVEGRGDPGRV